jgi:hypothetical protein
MRYTMRISTAVCNSRILAVCASAALVLGVGCSLDSPTSTGPDPQFDQKGHAAGGHPEISRFTDVFNFVIPEGEACPFAIGVDGQNKVMVQEFETHLAIHNNYTSTLTNLATGFAIDDNGAWMDIFHFDELGDLETVTTIGSIFRITIPGQGMVSQDTGIITFNDATGEVLFEGGPHENAHGTAPNVCTLLSGGTV